jgi:hypothetical protein
MKNKNYTGIYQFMGKKLKLDEILDYYGFNKVHLVLNFSNYPNNLLFP